MKFFFICKQFPINIGKIKNPQNLLEAFNLFFIIQKICGLLPFQLNKNLNGKFIVKISWTGLLSTLFYITSLGSYLLLVLFKITDESLDIFSDTLNGVVKRFYNIIALFLIISHSIGAIQLVFFQRNYLLRSVQFLNELENCFDTLKCNRKIIYRKFSNLTLIFILLMVLLLIAHFIIRITFYCKFTDTVVDGVSEFEILKLFWSIFLLKIFELVIFFLFITRVTQIKYLYDTMNNILCDVCNKEIEMI